MPNFGSPLNNIKVASPCPADWESMYGNDRMRFCGQCKLNVYNLSGLTRDEAENLIMRAEGRLCVRYFQRADGTVITKDCPIGWALIKKKASVFATGALAIFVSAFSGGYLASAFNRKGPAVVGEIPVDKPERRIIMGALPVANTMPQTEDLPPVSVMGNIAVPPRARGATPSKPRTVGTITIKPVEHKKDADEMAVRTRRSAGV